jgi:phosphatidylserine/phosphatidylglycerophosphate/cardiolipin synthase-like enzyme
VSLYQLRIRWTDPQGLGTAYAKAVVVADEEVVFVTSANLTETALDRNIELGILLRSAFVLTICTYFPTLIGQRLLKLLPSC